jgi:two-component system, response regulator YesN
LLKDALPSGENSLGICSYHFKKLPAPFGAGGKPFTPTEHMSNQVLLVDDDDVLRGELKDYLEGYDVIEASSGEGALNLLRRVNDVGVVLLDIMMPGINGLDVLTEIKKTNPDVSVVILTGNSSKSVAIEALKSHADDFIEKPIDVNKIKEIIDQLLESKEEKDMPVLGIKGKVQKVKRFVEKNCYKKIRLNDVAQAVALSPKYLSRVFKQEMGMDFSEYRLNIQMERAKEFLLKFGYNVNQVAEKLGYENSESFSRQFKKIVRSTPTAYRKKSLKKRSR